MESKIYKLREVANWTNPDSEVTIPALQRGLVWKPSQVELLWDSILRGFPIGSFMLSDTVEKGEQGKYYLMDGQQRFNAISLGYNTVKKPGSVLWIDLIPPDVKNSTRKFWIKATTQPQPWGFKNDDDCSRLNTSEKRDALDKFELQGSIYNREFPLEETWPIKAQCPIPLWCLLDASKNTSNDAEAFLRKTREIFEATNFAYCKKINWGERACCYLKDVLFPRIVALDNYYVNCNHLPKEVIENEMETVTDAIEQTTLEVLFTRLNTGGTAISRDDLNYSAIKAYWPSIKHINDELAEKYMSPSKLVMLAFRLALTDQKDDSLKNELTIRQIRGCARKDDERGRIEFLYEHYLGRVLAKVDDWLGVSEEGSGRTPSVLRTTIARNSPDVYLLLMYFARVDIDSPIKITASQIKSLAFCLHWFTANNDKKGCVQEIFRRCKDGITLDNIQKGIARLMHDCKLVHIYNPDEVRRFVPKMGEDQNWRVWHSIPAPARQFFDRIFWNGNAESREMLLYAEREYINTHFANYDPARQDMWAEYNRPWDFDHIVARNRIVGKQGKFREYDKIWLDSIGNFAAISYESNRSKNDGTDFSEYHTNQCALDYDSKIETLPNRVIDTVEASVDFANITYNRFCRIYGKVYDDVIKETVGKTILSDALFKRKELFDKIVETYPNAVIHFAASDGNDHPLIREQDWTREWVGVGIEKGDFMVCVEWSARLKDEKPIEVECGIRKAIGTSIKEENREFFKGNDALLDNSWWYKCVDVDSLELEVIKEQLEVYLIEILNLSK